MSVTARFGVVADVDREGGCVRLSVMPEGALSGWLPALQPSPSVQWTAKNILLIGDQAYALFEGDGFECGCVIGFLPRQTFRGKAP